MTSASIGTMVQPTPLEDILTQGYWVFILPFLDIGLSVYHVGMVMLLNILLLLLLLHVPGR